LAAKTVTIIALLLIAAGFSGFGLAEIMPNNPSSENFDNFSEKNGIAKFFQEGILIISSSSTAINP